MNNSHSALQREWSKGKRRCPAAPPYCALKLSRSCITYMTHFHVCHQLLLQKKKPKLLTTFLIELLSFFFFFLYWKPVWHTAKPKHDCFWSAPTDLRWVHLFCNLVLEKGEKPIVDSSQRTSTSSSSKALSVPADWLWPHGKAAGVSLDSWWGLVLLLCSA